MKENETMAPADLTAAVLKGNHAKHRWLLPSLAIILCLLLVAGWLGWRAYTKAQNQLPPFVTQALQRGDINLVITATGNLDPTNQVTVGSELSGTTLEVYVDINDHVTQGQPLAKLDTSKLAQQTASSRAAVNSAEAGVVLSKATVAESDALLARQKELLALSEGKVPSKAVMDAATATAARARAELTSAIATVKAAEAQVRINENDLAKAIIKSPIDGIVLTRSIEPGQTVAASFTAPELFVIAENLAHMKLKVTIPEADIGRVAKGQKSSFSVDAWPDRVYTAVVSRVAFGSAITANVVTYLAELAVSNDDLSLRPGMTATADIQVAESLNVFLVPTAALRFTPAAPAAPSAATVKKTFVQSLIPMPTRGSRRPGGQAAGGVASEASTHIWILKDGVPVSLSVHQGLSDGRNTEISGEGLTEGLSVILRANAATT